MKIEVTKTVVFNGTGRLRPFSNHYAAVGPDGTRFTNSSLAELRGVIARKYGVTQKSLVFDIKEK